MTEVHLSDGIWNVLAVSWLGVWLVYNFTVLTCFNKEKKPEFYFSGLEV